MIRGAVQPPISSAESGAIVDEVLHTTGVLPSQAIRDVGFR